MKKASKKILYVIGQLNVGGAERQLLYLAAHLDRKQFEPVICTLSDKVTLDQEVKKAGIQLITLPRLMKPDLTRLWRLPAVIRRIQPDLIHSYLFVSNFWARLAGLFFDIPVVISERNANYYTRPFQIWSNKLLKTFTTLLVANSAAGREALIRSKEINSQQSLVIHNGLPLDQFDNLPSPLAIKRELGYKANHRVVGMVARMEYPKDYATFLKAMQSVHEANDLVRVLCIGSGSQMQVLKDMVKDLDLQNIVNFTGQRSDVPRLLTALDVFVLSSHHEGFPNAIMEAMAQAIPVVASCVGGVPELVEDGISGLLVSPDDVHGLANSVLSLLENPDRAAAMGSRGRQRIEDNFTIDQMVNQTTAAYRQILGD